MTPARFTVLAPSGSRLVLEFDIQGMSARQVAELKAELLRKVKEAQGEAAIVYDDAHQVLTDPPSLFPDLFDWKQPLPIHIPTPEEIREGEEDRRELSRFFEDLFNDYPTGDTP